MIELVEQTRLKQWMHPAPRSERQLNQLFGADCELVRTYNGETLAITTDTLSEEIAIGLYKDPYTLGYVSATASLSDLAAVGAQPSGLLLSACFAQNVSDAFRTEVSRGFCEAAQLGGTYVLGGDTSQGVATVLTSTGVGFCNSATTRIGAKEGDWLVLSGANGVGPAMAFAFLLGLDAGDLESKFRPILPPQTRRCFAQNANSMIDTSDGILAAVTSLCSLNKVGVSLEWNEQVLDPLALRFCADHDIPPWALWVAEHGDYQLLASVPTENLSKIGAFGKVIGRIVYSDRFEVVMPFGTRPIDTSWGQLVAQTKNSDYSLRFQRLISELKAMGF